MNITRYENALAGWLTPRRLRVYPAAMAGAALLAWLGRVAGPWAPTDRPLLTRLGPDFVPHYTGARFLLEGRLAQLFDWPTVVAAQRQWLGLAPSDGFSPYVKPPFTVVLWVPFALGSPSAGLILWWAAGVVAVLASAALLIGEWRPARAPAAWRLALAFGLFLPTVVVFVFGQTTPFMLLAFAAVVVLLRRERDLAAGLVLALLWDKPQLALGLVALAVGARRWAFAAGGLLGSAAWLGLGAALGPALLAQYPRVLGDFADWHVALAWSEHNLLHFGRLLLGPLVPAAGEALGLALMLGALALIAAWWRRAPWQPGTYAWDMRLAATLILGWLASPHLLLYDLALLALPLGMVWAQHTGRVAGRALDGGPLLAWTGAAYVAATFGAFATYAQQALLAAAGLPPVAVQLAVVALAGWALRVYGLAHAARTAPQPAAMAAPAAR